MGSISRVSHQFRLFRCAKTLIASGSNQRFHGEPRGTRRWEKLRRRIDPEIWRYAVLLSQSPQRGSSIPPSRSGHKSRVFGKRKTVSLGSLFPPRKLDPQPGEKQHTATPEQQRCPSGEAARLWCVGHPEQPICSAGSDSGGRSLSTFSYTNPGAIPVPFICDDYVIMRRTKA